MPPRNTAPVRAPIVTPFISSLITSKEYPSLPTANELQSVHSILSAKSNALALELQAAHELEVALGTKKKDREKDREKAVEGNNKKRKHAEEGSEASALAANAASGAKLEALERQRALDRLVPGGGKLGSPGGVKVKRERLSASPAPSNASSVGPKSHHPPITYGQSQQLKKKKKTNRIMDSDDERERARDRSTTLAMSPPQPQTTSGLKVKLPTQSKQRPVDPSPAPSTVASATDRLDWSLPAPASRPLVPPRPGVAKPLKPGPKRQADVDEDFSNTKAPSQTAFTTFWTSIEPYLKEIREDDLAMLAFKADAPETYDIPPRGRHYTEIWDEEDGQALGSTPRISVPNMRSGPTATPHWTPSTDLKDEVLGEEWKGLGNVTERVVAAVMGDAEGLKRRQEEVKGKMGEDGSREGLRVDVVDFEERMKRELRSVMLLGEHEEFDPSKREDDEITSALRQCQRQLLQQTSINDARKARLAEVAKDRLAYAEYITVLEGLEKSIESEWAKRVKKHGLTPKKNSSGQSTRPPVSDSLKKLVATRQRWISTVGQVMREKKGDSYLPAKSIYEGLDLGDDEEKDEKSVEDAVEVDSGDEQ